MIRWARDKGGKVAPIVNSIEISRRPEDVFAYVTDPSCLSDWQESVVSVRADSPFTVGSKAVVTRRVGRLERAMTNEMTELTPPTAWGIRGIDGPIRGNVKGTVEPLGDGERSRVTISLDFDGHGIGKLLLPLVVRRQVQAEMPRNLQRLKERLESDA
jgi:carbon monoxide dehydrogenase subunit G